MGDDEDQPARLFNHNDRQSQGSDSIQRLPNLEQEVLRLELADPDHEDVPAQYEWKEVRGQLELLHFESAGNGTGSKEKTICSTCHHLGRVSTMMLDSRCDYHFTVRQINASTSEGCLSCSFLCDVLSECVVTETEPKMAEYHFEIRDHTYDRSQSWDSENSTGSKTKSSLVIVLLKPPYRLWSSAQNLEVFSVSGSPHPWGNIGSALVPPPSSFSVGTVDFIMACLRTCEPSRSHKHAMCEAASKPHSLPKRVLEITRSTSNSPRGSIGVRLVETDGAKQPYFCLSHCWGGLQSIIKTTKLSLGSRRADIPLSTLPKTFRETVVVVNIIGSRLSWSRAYFWIDSLCIIKDDPNDWAVESAENRDATNPIPVNSVSVQMQWYAIVKEYSKLRLTYASDRLPALAGIAKQLAQSHTMHYPDESTRRQSRYLAGLWEDTLLDDLLWSTYNNRCKPATSPAPSWSWPSIDGFIYYPLDTLIDSCYATVSATIETASDPFLSAPSGHLTITAPLVTGHIDSNPTAEHSRAVENLVLRLGNEKYTISYPELNLDFGGNGGRLQIKEGDILSCARLARITKEGEQFLLLKPCERHAGFYERVGLIRLGVIDRTRASDAERIYEGSPTVTLIVV
ncbi:putative Heterokaryon incompatibility domain-containing protein [Seiridium unicorne]|uniref:Heterokaryon incompatibility domain-containing protein n=1 Tax=Seiridium unicorne TaxID=138068 RepID=A0ABR2UPP7_9PEZI